VTDAVVTRVTARFTGERAVTAPLTWGQRCILQPILEVAPHDAFFNVRRVLAAPRRRPVTVERAADAIGALVARHESLRTRIRSGPDGWYQEVLAAGSLDPHVVAAEAETAESVARALMERLAAVRFDLAADLPVRAGFVTVDGVVDRLVLVVSHLSVDGHAMDVLLRDLRLLLVRGAVPHPPALQPADLARRESDPDGGARQAEATRRYWAEAYRGMPSTMFPLRAAPADPPAQRLALTSPALGLAARRLAADLHTSTSAVLLAATCAAVADHAGQSRCAMFTNVGNRFRADLADVVAPLSQLGVLLVDLADGPDFATLVSRTAALALRACRHAYYDLPVERAVLAEEEARRGTPVHPHACFNDVRTAPDTAAAPPSTVDVRAAAPATISAGEPPGRAHCRFCVEVHDAREGVTVLLTADTRALPPEEMRWLLRDIERRVVEAACAS